MKVAVIGGGIGGITAALALLRVGIDVDVYEQSPEDRRIGAAITMTPNAVRVLDRLGVGTAIRAAGYQPPRRLNRVWNTGEITATIELGDAAEKKFGAPLLQLHRTDVIDALTSALPAGVLQYDLKLDAIREVKDRLEARFSDGSTAVVDAIVGADGIHSTVREILFGPDSPRFTGVVGFRSIIPAARLSQFDLTPFTKWFGPRPESEFLTTMTSSRGDFYVFASIAQPEWRQESWSLKSQMHELREEFSDYADEVRVMLDVCDETLKTAIYQRDPLPRWTEGRITLLGDACHAMMPFMAQGAAMAIEDAAVLSRCLDGRSVADIPSTLELYQRARKERTGQMQLYSQQNQWPRTPADIEWVYSYDAWNVRLPA